MVLAGVLGTTGMVLAAWSSHGLAALVPADELALAVSRAQTANQYLMVHALALLGLAIAHGQAPSRWLTAAGVLWALGALGFAGGLYGLRIVAGIHTGPSVYVVPVGGACLIGGWVMLAVAGWRRPCRTHVPLA